MTGIFSKPLNELTADDVHALVKDEYPEGSSVEYKVKLPHKSGGIDSWYSAGNGIGDYARNEILEEVIAFANTHGGHVILGIRESEDKPHRAVGIELIPRCDELAERLRYHLRDGIDPQIPLVHAHGVRIDGDSGVIVLRVPQSRMAPHRHKWTFQCYNRHADRTEKMTMREIQDLTLKISRGLEEIESTYKKRSEEFHALVAKRKAIGLRATLIPLSPLFTDKIGKSHEFFQPWRRFILSIDEIKKEIIFPVLGYTERPILRGFQRSSEGQDVSLFQRIYSDGLVELCFLKIRNEDELLYQSWVLATAANGLLMADAFRKAVGSPDVEYGLELELFNPIGPVTVSRFSESYALDKNLLPIESPCILPRYSFGELIEISRLAEEILKDINNAGGAHHPQGKYMLSW